MDIEERILNLESEIALLKEKLTAVDHNLNKSKDECFINKPSDVFELYTIKEASKLLQISEQGLRVALQQGLFPFGVAVKLKDYTYYIFKNRLHCYLEARDMGA